MPTINFYLEPEDIIAEPDQKKLAKNIQGKTVTFTLPAKFLNGDKVKSSFDLQKELVNLAGTFGLSKDAKKLLKDKAGIQGKLGTIGSYTLVFTVTTEDKGKAKTHRLKGDLEIVAKDPIEEPEPSPVTYANAKVRSACNGDKNIATKIASIAIAGPKETGHGPVPYLNKALHAHATNSLSVAWFWKSGTMHVVATGKKNNENKTQKRGGKGSALKTMQYDWDEG